MPSLDQTWQDATSALKKAGIDHPRREAQYLLCAHQKIDASQLYTTPEAALHDTELFDIRLQLRCAHCPLSRIFGTRAFWRDDFVVTDAVLDPRSDSEVIIRAALKLQPDTAAALRLLDLGTGSGCLLLSLLREYPYAYGIGVDHSPAALDVAHTNARALGLTARSDWQHSNWWKNVSGLFDLIVCNPPYIDHQTTLPRSVQYDPATALFADNHGLQAYIEILPRLAEFMKPRAVALFESHPQQTVAITRIALNHSLRCHSILRHTQPLCPPQQLGLVAVTPV